MIRKVLQFLHWIFVGVKRDAMITEMQNFFIVIRRAFAIFVLFFAASYWRIGELLASLGIGALSFVFAMLLGAAFSLMWHDLERPFIIERTWVCPFSGRKIPKIFT